MNVKLKSAHDMMATTDCLSKNLTALMKQENISSSDLARSLNIPYNSIQRLVSGFTSDPRVSTLKLIANYFNVSLDVLTGENESSFSQAFPQKDNSPRFIPIFSWEDIVNPDFFTQTNITTWENWQPVALSPSEKLSKKAYAIESKRSMQPRFPMGTIFVVDPDQTAMDDDLVLVRMKETNAVSLRDLRIDPPSWQLLPVIESSAVIAYDDTKHVIIGIVVLTMIQSRKF
tara:strand:- start:6254 stop:6943 length:690 start_codon:yes stop_codon:yes gene_type:complete